MPGWAEATNDPCGRVYLVNADNELLRLRRSATILALEGGLLERDRNRRLDVLRRTPITGLADKEFLLGVDFRPSNGLLYGVGRIGGDPMALGQLYTIDVGTGAATAVGARTIPLNGNAFGVDFNPVPDLLRIVSDIGQNIRIRPVDGGVAGTDTNLAYPAMGDPNATRMPRVVAVSYTNPDTDVQTNTVLHDLDVNRAADAVPGLVGHVLAIQVPPNGGVLNTVGRLGIDADDLAAFDIGLDNEALAAILRAGSEAPGSTSSTWGRVTPRTSARSARASRSWVWRSRSGLSAPRPSRKRPGPLLVRGGGLRLPGPNTGAGMRWPNTSARRDVVASCPASRRLLCSKPSGG
jgi:hypothetical protein